MERGVKDKEIEGGMKKGNRVWREGEMHGYRAGTVSETD